MSNSVFQSVIVQLRDVSDRTFGVIDTEGSVVSCTDMSLLGERWADAALKVGNSAENVVTFGQKSFKARRVSRPLWVTPIILNMRFSVPVMMSWPRASARLLTLP